MPRKPKDTRPTERTAKGYEVPIPDRGEFFANLKKVSKPKKGKDSGSASGSRKK
jgi:hypothetical protein